MESPIRQKCFDETPEYLHASQEPKPKPSRHIITRLYSLEPPTSAECGNNTDYINGRRNLLSPTQEKEDEKKKKPWCSFAKRASTSRLHLERKAKSFQIHIHTQLRFFSFLPLRPSQSPLSHYYIIYLEDHIMTITNAIYSSLGSFPVAQRRRKENAISKFQGKVKARPWPGTNFLFLVGEQGPDFLRPFFNCSCLKMYNQWIFPSSLFLIPRLLLSLWRVTSTNLWHSSSHSLFRIHYHGEGGLRVELTRQLGIGHFGKINFPTWTINLAIPPSKTNLHSMLALIGSTYFMTVRDWFKPEKRRENHQ